MKQKSQKIYFLSDILFQTALLAGNLWLVFFSFLYDFNYFYQYLILSLPFITAYQLRVSVDLQLKFVKDRKIKHYLTKSKAMSKYLFGIFIGCFGLLMLKNDFWVSLIGIILFTLPLYWFYSLSLWNYKTL